MALVASYADRHGELLERGRKCLNINLEMIRRNKDRRQAAAKTGSR
jgi:hypothetical protein